MDVSNAAPNVTMFEANAGQPARLSLGAVARKRVGVGSDQLRTRMGAFGPDREIASTTADFQDTLVLGEFGLIDQTLMHSVEAEQAGQ